MAQEQTYPKGNIGWVPLPMAMCLGVGFYLPGPFSVVLGFAAAAVCFVIARRDQWKESVRITSCVIVVALSYMIAGGITGGRAVIEANIPASNSRIDMNSETERMKVFNMAMQFKTKIQQGEREVNEAIKSDARNYDSLKSRLTSRKASHEKHQLFTARFYQLSSEELTRIIDEGTAEDWPY